MESIKNICRQKSRFFISFNKLIDKKKVPRQMRANVTKCYIFISEKGTENERKIYYI